MAQSRTHLRETLSLGMQTNVEDAEGRHKRAREQPMAVIPVTDPDGDATGIYEVYSQSGNCYTVDLDAQDRCECKDMQYNEPDGGCKHRRRVAIMVRETTLPATGQNADEYLRDLQKTHDHLTGLRAALLDRLETTNYLLTAVEEASDD